MKVKFAISEPPTLVELINLKLEMIGSLELVDRTNGVNKKSYSVRVKVKPLRGLCSISNVSIISLTFFASSNSPRAYSPFS